MSTEENVTIEEAEVKEEMEKDVWVKLQELKDAKTPVDVTIDGIVKAGVVAHIDGIRGFIPASRLSLNYVENLDEYLNKPMKVRVFEVEKESKKLILSAREILREEARAARQAKLNAIQPGTVMEGKVETIKPYGAFIDLGDGISGLLHISQISTKRIKTPEEVLAVGDPVTVKVTANKEGKLSLSIKALTAPVEEAKPVEEEETYVLPKAEELTTNLGSLFKNLKLN